MFLTNSFVILVIAKIVNNLCKLSYFGGFGVSNHIPHLAKFCSIMFLDAFDFDRFPLPNRKQTIFNRNLAVLINSTKNQIFKYS